jgi:hypothetical protein
LRLEGLMVRRREILAEGKLCPCLCHLTSRVASSWLSSAQCPHSAAILQHSSADDCMALLCGCALAGAQIVHQRARCW